MKKIFAISGSVRTNSSNWKILELIAKEYKEQLNVEIYTDLDKLPHFNPNLKSVTNFPPIVQTYFEKIKNADGVLICTPESLVSGTKIEG